MVDDYDGLDYSRSNPPPDPALKWDTDDGITAMQQVWNVAVPEIRAVLNQVIDPKQHNKIARWAEAFEHYIYLQTGQRGAKSFVGWVQKAVPREVPLFSMTFGQMFEEAIAARGLHPYNSTKTQTFWTGTWMSRVEGRRPEQPYEGYGIVTRPHGWSVIYQEDRSKGLSAGWIGGRIRYGRGAEKRPGVVVRRVITNLWPDATGLNVYSHNMDVLHGPGARRAGHRLDEYIHLYGAETYNGAIERVIELAAAVADFMNDRDFHVLEALKRDIRRHEHARPLIDPQGGMFNLQKKVPEGLRDLIGDAAVLSEQLHLGKRAYDLFKVFYTGRWDGEGWRETTDDYGRPLDTSLPETLEPDRINVYNATRLGDYPVQEWQGMPEEEE